MCNPTQDYIDMFSDYTYQWFMDNNPTDFVLTVYNPHIFISKSGILYFSSVDASDDRDYHCTVSITDGAPESRSSPAYSLEVTYRDGEYKHILPAICSLIKNAIGQKLSLCELIFLKLTIGTRDSIDSGKHNRLRLMLIPNFCICFTKNKYKIQLKTNIKVGDKH